MYIWLRNIILISAAVVVALLILIFRDKIGKVLIKINGLMKKIGRKVSSLLDTGFTNFRKMNISLSFYIGFLLIASFCLFVYGFNNKDDTTSYVTIQLKGKFYLADVCEDIIKKEKPERLYISSGNKYSYHYNGVFKINALKYAFVYTKGNNVYGMKVVKYGESDDYTNTVKFKVSIVDIIISDEGYIDYQRNKELIKRAFENQFFYPNRLSFSYLNQKTVSMEISHIKNVEIDEDTIFGFSRGMEGDIYYTGFAFLSNYEDFDHETIKSNSRCLEVSVNFPIDIFIPHKFIGDIYSYYLYEHIVSSTEPCKADNYYVP